MPNRCYVNLGCGHRFHREWRNFDLISSDPCVTPCDLSRGIPLPDATADAVYHSNMLEHLRPAEGLAFLRECRRVLRPGGILRVAIPDLEGLCRAYLAQLEAARRGEPDAAANREWMVLELVDQMVRETSGGAMLDYLRRQPLENEAFVLGRIGQEGRGLLDSLRNSTSAAGPVGRKRRLLRGLRESRARLREWLRRQRLTAEELRAYEVGRFRLSGEVHQWMYDDFSLAEALRAAGFTAVERMTPHTSRIAEWNTFHLEVLPDGTIIKPDSIQVEAQRPEERTA